MEPLTREQLDDACNIVKMSGSEHIEGDGTGLSDAEADASMARILGDLGIPFDYNALIEHSIGYSLENAAAHMARFQPMLGLMVVSNATIARELINVLATYRTRGMIDGALAYKRAMAMQDA